ncbi:MAG: hypothetical protein J1F02_08990 [Lachnospiraceae bacterium]|nr:hypothetical protein [Lachnospiraceae bacterium]
MDTENIVFQSEDVSQNKVYGVLAYLGLLFLVPLFAAKDSLYARFHTNQGLVLFLSEIILTIAGQIIGFVFRTIITVLTLGLLGWIIPTIINFAVSVVCLVYTILGIVNACSGEPKKLPIIGNITLLK